MVETAFSKFSILFNENFLKKLLSFKFYLK